MVKIMDKKYLQFYAEIFCLSKPMAPSQYCSCIKSGYLLVMINEPSMSVLVKFHYNLFSGFHSAD